MKGVRKEMKRRMSGEEGVHDRMVRKEEGNNRGGKRGGKNRDKQRKKAIKAGREGG